MPKINWERTKKQSEAWDYLNDKTTNELLFGGGAGGAKTFLGCAWLILMCLKYEGTRWVMARNVLKRLKETTLATFFEVCSMWGIRKDLHFKYNPVDGTIKFANGSIILLKELFASPSDPEFDSLGSLEITGAFVDEANQITAKAVNILKSRIRFKLDQHGLIPKVLFTCNPAKNWVYTDFYKPNRDKTLPKHKRFVQALVKDNPFISEHYVENLKKLDKNSRERLLNGNWEYDDDPSLLMEYDTILDLFTNKAEPNEEKFISCDVARMGKDKTVIAIWHGLQCIKINSYPKTKVNETIDYLDALCRKHGIRRSKVIIDEDGVGGGVVDGFDGCKGFVNNSKALKPMGSKEAPNFSNLKTQCWFEFARLAKDGKIGIEQIEISDKELLTEELGQIKQKDPDKDGKISLIGKDVIKENIGRSPDLADALMMRMYFELNNPNLTAYFV